MTLLSRVLWIAAAAVALAPGLPVCASDPDAAVPGAPQAPPAQRIAIDPRTGMIAAAPPASAAPRPAVRSAPLAGVRLPGGAVRVDLKGRYRLALAAHRDAAGTITTTCVTTSAGPEGQAPAAVGQGEVPREK